MRICVLSSGSGGNCLWIEAGGTRVLVDAGLSIKATEGRCAEAGLDLREATDLLITHEHADHAMAAGALARKRGLRVHASPGTLRALRDPPPPELCFPLVAGQPLLLGALRVEPVGVPHDAAEPLAFAFEERTPQGRVRAALVTDLGCAPRTLPAALGTLDALVLETNHDVRLLEDGPYPLHLKRRIRSDVGHLSNAQAAQLLRALLHPGLRHVVLAHLSEHNNTPSHARRAAEDALSRGPCMPRLEVAGQFEAQEPIDLGPLPAKTPRPRQLSLFGA